MESTWIPIFEAGSHKLTVGGSKVFTEADLDAIVSNYDPGVRETPLVFGFPRMEDPAYGWVRAFKREGRRLLANFRQVAPEIVRKLGSGIYRIKYVSFMPGGALRHISFTGDAPPAIPGLEAVFGFSEGGSEFMECEPQFDGFLYAGLTNKV